MAQRKNAVKTILSRNAFYRDGYRLLQKVVLLEGVTILGLVVVVLAGRTPENRFFATRHDGSVIPLVPLDNPTLSKAGLINWAARTVSV
ncbi:hypothetical protein GCM10007972_15590 [Iodidimonas muriae]|uniref:Uncharacterized protein n=1 Tax=Iodidimonas muriae TaxID=261467 RepID=A0ABQ2LD21_9PROT|nr:DotI/IcmL/TraM family protein [Iodidimonas muriae]GER07180.1 hypothetical protein JCM17843_14900 [Kordiimonadales bacterium JCM 17843]GGO11634.1 hypothetical protein GCM10007972_15590 [Iodidimonas muriae]